MAWENPIRVVSVTQMLNTCRVGSVKLVKGPTGTRLQCIGSRVKPGRLTPAPCFPEFVEGGAKIDAPKPTETLEEAVEVSSGECVRFDEVVQPSGEVSVPVAEPMPTLPSELLDHTLNELTVASQASELPTEKLIATEKDADLAQNSKFVDESSSSGENESVLLAMVPSFVKDWLYGDDGKRNRSLVLLNIMTFLFSTNYVVVKDAESILDPYTFSALRFIVGALAFAPFLGFASKERQTTSTDAAPPLDRDTVLAGFEIGVWSTFGYLTQTLGMKYTDASKAAFLGGLLVVMVPFFGGLMGKKIPKAKWVGAVVAVVGTSFLEQGSSTAFGIGDLFSLASAMFFGFQMIRTEAYSKALSAKSALPILGIATATTALISSGIAIYTHPGETLSLLYSLKNHTTYVTNSLSNLPWAVILYTGALTTALVLFIEMSAFKNVTATDAAIVYTVQPVMSGLMALTFLGERFTTSGWVGAAIIVCGSLGAQLLGAEEVDGCDEADMKELASRETLTSTGPTRDTSGHDLTD